jgi:hypothetical protein
VGTGNDHTAIFASANAFSGVVRPLAAVRPIGIILIILVSLIVLGLILIS